MTMDWGDVGNFAGGKVGWVCTAAGTPRHMEGLRCD